MRKFSFTVATMIALTFGLLASAPACGGNNPQTPATSPASDGAGGTTDTTCTKNSDCKGDKACTNGVCIQPPGGRRE